MKFKIGDPIRITLSNCRHHNQVGVIAEISEGRAYPYRVEGVEDWWFSDAEITRREAL